MMQQERRLYSRKTLNPLPYVSLPSGNGGIVLDVSEQGLCFRAVNPVMQSGPIHFSFSAYSKRIEGIADLVWTDRDKKTGGLRFTQLSDDAREQIREWPHELDLRLSVGQGFMLQIPASDDSSTPGVLRRSRFDATLHFATTWSNRVGSTVRECLHSGIKGGMAESYTLRLKNSFRGRRNELIAALGGTIVVIMISVLLSHTRHRAAGESFVALTPRIVGEVAPQTIRQTPLSNPLPPEPGAGHAPADKSKVGGAQEQATQPSANPATLTFSNRKASSPPAPQVPAANVPLPSAATPGGKLVVQVAALTREMDARKLAESLRQENFQAFVGTLPVDKLYRVMTGPYANEPSARVAVAKLKKAGLDSFVRRESGVVLAGSLETKTP
jgi:hypothetical protein